jgi:putative hemolysin
MGSRDDAEAIARGSSARQAGIRSILLKRLERLSGVHKYMAIYEAWRREIAGVHPRKMNELLRLLNVSLEIHAPQWPARVTADQPLVMVANHPFGIGDGIALAAMAEQLERPYKVLINTEFERFPEFREHCLPIHFSDTREALAINLETRRRALAALAAGEILLVFPAGTVATAPRVFGRAQEVPWKTFTAGLVQKAKASVLPVFFEGQNSLLFHAASHVSASARLSLLIAEFRRFPRSVVKIRAGRVAAFDTLQGRNDRAALTDELFLQVHRLAPWARGMADEAILPPAWMRERPYKWDIPLGGRQP